MFFVFVLFFCFLTQAANFLWILGKAGECHKPDLCSNAKGRIKFFSGERGESVLSFGRFNVQIIVEQQYSVGLEKSSQNYWQSRIVMNTNG